MKSTMHAKSPSVRSLQKKLSDLEAAHEIGKIFNALLDRTSLCGFFLQMAGQMLGSEQAVLWLREAKRETWEKGTSHGPALSEAWEAELLEWARSIFEKARPEAKVISRSGRARAVLGLPLVVRNRVWAVACLVRPQEKKPFSSSQIEVGMALANQAASALKNIEFYQENVRSERLAAIGQTISILSHEMKNRLGIILGGQYLVNRGMERHDWEGLQKSWQIMSRNTRDLQEFVLDLLSLTHERQPVVESIDLNPFLEGITKELEAKAAEKSASLQWKPAPQPVTIQADPRGLRSIVQNLVGNALEACDKPSSWVRLEARTAPETKGVELVISDNGKGIPEEDQKKLFQLFFTTKGRKGTGLGLVICEKIATEHGGKIQCSSQPGRGTAFRVWLPLTPHTKDVTLR